MTDDGIRLAKRVAELAGCSRAEAERYIAGGWVSVDGAVVEEPATRVTPAQAVALLPGATPTEPLPVTILLHKPAGVATEAALAAIGADTLDGEGTFLRRHLHRLTPVLPLAPEESGLLVLTQDWRVLRKLQEEGARTEQEFVAEVTGTVAESGLPFLNRGALKVSWQSERRLRFAGKGIVPGLIGQQCAAVGLTPVALRRLRIGRVALAKLAPGHWRYLGQFERF